MSWLLGRHNMDSPEIPGLSLPSVDAYDSLLYEALCITYPYSRRALV